MKHHVKNAHTLAAIFALGACGALGQTPAAVGNAAAPKFEVASIKPADPSARGFRIQTAPGGRYIATGVTVKFLIAQAYGVRDFQISGGPGWIDSLGYEINAKAESGTESKPGEMGMRLQGLLADRFQLKLTRETKELPIYALVIAKGGSKLKENSTEGGMSMGRGKLTGTGMVIGSVVNALSQQLGRTVVDKTGLTGNYDFKLEWTPDLGQQQPGAKEIGGTETAPPDSGPTIFTALQEQLGLKLESTKGPVEILVIDRVEKPTEN
jgi:bla regulator protein blaR1